MTDATRTWTLAAPERLLLPRLRLRATAGASVGLDRTFEQRSIDIGSAPDNDFVVLDPSVSRYHARLEGEHGGLRIRDLGSKNGVWANGIRLFDAVLASATSVRLGQAELQVEPQAQTHEVEIAREEQFGRLVGQSRMMRELFARLARVAATDVTVLIEGESGTGKELAAEAVHRHSRRAQGPWVVFDCSAVQPNLLESELFGHVRGAFTGAVASRAGALVEADGGTLFLDEIGELPLDLQPKLLRALEQHEVRVVGSNERRRVDVRIVAATNRDLRHMVEEGTFREDLYWRLHVVHLVMPPLRRRPEDIPQLVRHFLADANARGDGTPRSISYETMQQLRGHAWPGNVRELRNAIERAAVLSSGRELEVDVIVDARRGHGEGAGGLPVHHELPFKDAKARLIDAFERDYWQRALQAHGWNLSAAARATGLHRKSLEYVLRKLSLERPGEGQG